MPITNYGLEMMGFEKFDKEDSISCIFHSINIIKISNINIDYNSLSDIKKIKFSEKYFSVWLDRGKDELFDSLIVNNLIKNKDMLDKDKKWSRCSTAQIT